MQIWLELEQSDRVNIEIKNFDSLIIDITPIFKNAIEGGITGGIGESEETELVVAQEADALQEVFRVYSATYSFKSHKYEDIMTLNSLLIRK